MTKSLTYPNIRSRKGISELRVIQFPYLRTVHHQNQAIRFLKFPKIKFLLKVAYSVSHVIIVCVVDDSHHACEENYHKRTSKLNDRMRALRNYKVGDTRSSTHHLDLGRLEKNRHHRRVACDPENSSQSISQLFHNIVHQGLMNQTPLTFRSCHEAEGGNPVTITAKSCVVKQLILVPFPNLKSHKRFQTMELLTYRDSRSA